MIHYGVSPDFSIITLNVIENHDQVNSDIGSWHRIGFYGGENDNPENLTYDLVFSLEQDAIDHALKLAIKKHNYLVTELDITDKIIKKMSET